MRKGANRVREKQSCQGSRSNTAPVSLHPLCKPSCVSIIRMLGDICAPKVNRTAWLLFRLNPRGEEPSIFTISSFSWIGFSFLSGSQAKEEQKEICIMRTNERYGSDVRDIDVSVVN